MRLGDFIDRVCDEYRGSVRDMKGASLSTRGAQSIRALVRTDENGKYRVLRIPPRMNLNTEVTDSVLRSHCHQLGINPADFGVAEEEEHRWSTLAPEAKLRQSAPKSDSPSSPCRVVRGTRSPPPSALVRRRPPPAEPSSGRKSTSIISCVRLSRMRRSGST